MEVRVNGELRCVAGIGEHQILHTIVGHIHRSPANLAELQDRWGDDDDWEPPEPETLDLSVGGLDMATDTDIRWLDHAPLVLGDEVSVRLVERANADPVVITHAPSTAEERRLDTEQTVRDLAAELGWTLIETPATSV